MEREQLVSLVQAVQRGEPGADSSLYENFYNDVYYFIFKTVNDEELAADLTQDTFIEILQTIGKLNEPAAFVTWSRQIAYHKCTAHFRKRHDLLADEDEDGYSVFDTVQEDRAEFIPHEALDQEDLKQTIHGMINQLPEEQRSALLMRYYNEMPVSEIAKVQGVSEGTVKSRLNYGRKAIKKSVEDYEKRSGVKLHCAGVVPLLLWLFAVSKPVTAKATEVAADAAGNVVADTVASGAKKLAASAGKKLALKIVAGAAATAVAGGGVAAAVNMNKEEPPEPEPVMEWVGYGDVFSYSDRRFDLTIEEMDEDKITGNLLVTYQYSTYYESEFSGEATETREGQTFYQISFDEDLVEGILNSRFNDPQLVYEEDKDRFVIDDYFEVVMDRVNTDPKTLLEDASFAGEGKDSLYVQSSGHRFDLTVDTATETTISGHMKLTYNDSVDQDTDFTGRGFYRNGKYIYEVLLDTPRPYDVIGTDGAVDRMWLVYDKNEDTMELSAIFYDVFMRREK